MITRREYFFFFFFYVQPISVSIETIGMLVDHYEWILK